MFLFEDESHQLFDLEVAKSQNLLVEEDVVMEDVGVLLL